MSEWTAKRVAQKVEWEGGVLAALDYGITADRIEPGPLRDAWAELEQAYRGLVPLMGRVDLLIRQARSTPDTRNEDAHDPD